MGYPGTQGANRSQFFPLNGFGHQSFMAENVLNAFAQKLRRDLALNEIIAGTKLHGFRSKPFVIPPREDHNRRSRRVLKYGSHRIDPLTIWQAEVEDYQVIDPVFKL